MKRVLVLLAAYNGGKWIQSQIESVLAQRDVMVNILVRDDGSCDDTRSVVAGLAATDSRVQLLPPGASSGSASGNFFQLMAYADVGDIDALAFCDQDDIWQPRKLARAMHFLETTGASGVSSSVLARWEDGRERVLAQNPRQRSADFLFEGAGQGCTFVLNQKFFTRVQDFLSIGDGAPAMHFHDWYVYLLARTWGLDWAFDGQPSMVYRQHGANEIGARGGPRALARRLSMVRMGWYAQEVQKAVQVYRSAGGHTADLLSMARLLESRSTRSARDSLKLALWLMSHGRRRLSDRIVLCGSALLRWI